MTTYGPASHSYVSQRLRLHYVDWGNEAAPPLLLVHGNRDHCRNWDWVAEALRDRYHILAPDLRGHGDSQWMVGGNYGLVDYVYDIAQLIHQRGLAPLTIIGHSLGGHISMQYAGVYPENVQQAGLDRGLRPAAGDARSGARARRRRSACGAGSTSCASSPAAQPRRYASIDEATARMREANPQPVGRARAAPDDPRRQPERGRQLQLEVRQLRARDLAVLLQRRRDVRALVEDQLPDLARARHRRAGPATPSRRAHAATSRTRASRTSRRPATGRTTTSSTCS